MGFWGHSIPRREQQKTEFTKFSASGVQTPLNLLYLDFWIGPDQMSSLEGSLIAEGIAIVRVNEATKKNSLYF